MNREHRLAVSAFNFYDFYPGNNSLLKYKIQTQQYNGVYKISRRFKQYFPAE